MRTTSCDSKTPTAAQNDGSMAALDDIAALERDFPRKRCSASALIRDSIGNILIVKPTYREGWLLPGGIVEAMESPVDAVCREVFEEIGFKPKPEFLACVDHLSPSGGFGEAIHFMFACQEITSEQVNGLAIDGREIEALRFVAETEAYVLLLPAIVRRIRESLSGKPGYFHDGYRSVPFMASPNHSGLTYHTSGSSTSKEDSATAST